MRTAININLNATLPPADEVAKAPFFPTYQLAYAHNQTAFYNGQSFGIILQQFDAFDVYITVLEVKARRPDALPIAIPIETLYSDLHWLYQIKGTLTIETILADGRRKLQFHEGRQTQVYSYETQATLHVTESHTLSVAIVAKAQWLIRHQPIGTYPVEKLISFLRERARQCVTSRDTALDPAMPYLAELLSLPKLEGEPMDAAIARPVSQLVRLARGKADRTQNPDTEFVAAIQRQVANHFKAGYIPSIAELAMQNGLGVRSLRRRYHTASGQKLQTYIAKSRLAEGLRLMIEERLTVSEAALAIGYAETSVFSKQFKKQYGQSPRAYLKLLGAPNYRA